jgi:hypothetical protein
MKKKHKSDVKEEEGNGGIRRGYMMVKSLVKRLGNPFIFMHSALLYSY